MPKLRPRQKLVCVPCGREIVVSSAGVSRTTLWCCGKPMAAKAGAKRKATKKKAARRTVRKKK